MTHAAVEDELASVLSHYDLGKLRAAQRTERGFVNDNWIVDTDRRRCFVKRRHPSLCQPDLIRAQHALVEGLRRAGFPAPIIFATAAGKTCLVLNAKFYEVQSYIEGQPFERDRPAHLNAAAQTLGRFHATVKDFEPGALRERNPLYCPSNSRAIWKRLRQAWQLDQEPELAQITQRLEVRLDDLASRFEAHRTLPYLVIHGDYYAGNLIFDGDCIVGVVDFDKANWQPRVAEVAEALIYFASPRPGHLQHLVYSGFLQREPFACFLQNYARAATLAEREIRALPDYICCIWLSISLQRLLEQNAQRPTMAQEALEEVLALSDWASDNAQWMIDVARLAMKETK